MRPLATLTLVVGLTGNLAAAPPTHDGDAGPREMLTRAEAEDLKNRTPLTAQEVAKMVGPPARARRTTTQPELMFWTYRVPAGRITLLFKNGHLIRASFPTG
jgi:hypothetical protein